MVSREAGVAGSSGDGPKPGKRRTVSASIKLDLNKARKYAPDQSVLHHCPLSERIRGFCQWLPARDSHGCSLCWGQDVACRVVLEWLWTMWSFFESGETSALRISVRVGVTLCVVEGSVQD